MLPFQDVRVVELGSGIALSFAGKLFADFGADVLKIEPLAGDPLRQMPPLADVGGERRESAYWAWLNTNKQSVALDLATASDGVAAQRLIAGADILIDARELPSFATGALAHDALRDAHPGLIVGALSPFGEFGPYRDFKGSEAVCRSLAGVIKAVGPVEGPPLLAHDGTSALVGGLAVFIATASSWLAREQGGQRHSISLHEALTLLVELDIGYAMQGAARPRSGINRFGRHYPASIYAASDGWIGVSTVTPAQWRSMCVMIGRPEMASDPAYATSAARLQNSDALDALLIPLFQSQSTDEWFALGMANRLPLVIVPTMEQLLRQHVHRERGAFVPVEIGSARFEGPILPQRLEPGSPRPGGRAPLLDEHDAAVLRAPRRPAVSGRAAADRLPLAGKRVLDLTMGWAGPLATRLVADLGAEVIKIEGCTYPDWYRGTDLNDTFLAERGYERNVGFNVLNRNKLGITLDLTDPEGTQLFKELVAQSDAVIENYSAEVLPKLGLDYPTLAAVNPRLIMVSMAAFGAGNAWSPTRAYGGTLEQASGLPVVSGFEHWPPTMTTYAHGDPIGGYNAAAALVIGLLNQQRTGSGRYINMSQIEGMLSLAAPSIIEQSLDGHVSPRLGNQHPVHAPQGCYPCAGADGWITITIRDADEWRALCGVIGATELCANEALDAAAERARHAPAIDQAIAAWTAGQDADEAMALLQAAGVPAGAVRSTTELLDDPHLRARGYWQQERRAFVGEHELVSSPFRLSDGPLPTRFVAPTLGQHTRDVLGRLTALSDAELDALEARGIIGTQARRKSAA